MSETIEKIHEEVLFTKMLGDKYGYGYIMAMCRELWVRQLKEAGLPETTANCSVSVPMVKDEFKTFAVEGNPDIKSIISSMEKFM